MLLLFKGLIVLAALAVITVLAAQLGLFSGTPPADLGVHDGRLKPPATSPNSVSSQADLYPEHPRRESARIAPLALPADAHGDGAAAIARLQTLLAAMPGARVVEVRADYLYAQFTTPLMHYVDDTEFWFDPAARVIQVRSASRIGESDLGLNRQRIEAIRAALTAR
ncbi:MAG: DUF1499 domain-containing protein [Leptothrix sp. (in: b-proteobacteria)]